MFLKNFIKVEKDKLFVKIPLEQALHAGASYVGYQALQNQISNINKTITPASLGYWASEVQKLNIITKSTASFEGEYDKYNVLKRDTFLENFIYFENGVAQLKISQVDAIKCGATIQGYLNAIIAIGAYNELISDGSYDYEECKIAFDTKRQRLIGIKTKSDLDGEPLGPPKGYYMYSMHGDEMTHNSGSIYGSPDVNVYSSTGTLTGRVTITEIPTGVTNIHYGITGVSVFRGSLTFKEGTWYVFNFTKSSSTFVVNIGINEYRSLNAL